MAIADANKVQDALKELNKLTCPHSPHGDLTT